MTDDARGEDTAVVLNDGLDPPLRAPADAAGQAVHTEAHASSRLPLKALSWSLYEGVRDPYVIMITIYIFAPYFATVVVGDPVAGQKMVANIGLIGGLFVAFTGPLLGASIDKIGRRKPLLLLMTALMIPVIAGLWWAKPGGTGLCRWSASPPDHRGQCAVRLFGGAAQFPPDPRGHPAPGAARLGIGAVAGQLRLDLHAEFRALGLRPAGQGALGLYSRPPPLRPEPDDA